MQLNTLRHTTLSDVYEILSATDPVWLTREQAYELCDIHGVDRIEFLAEFRTMNADHNEVDAAEVLEWMGYGFHV